MTVYYMPSVAALLASLVLLGTFFYGRKSSSSFYSLIIIFACVSLCELLGFLRFFEQGSLVYLLKTYYVLSVIAVAFLAYYVDYVTGRRFKNISAVIFTFAALIACITLFSDMIVSGTQSIGYMMTATKGEFYIVFQIYSSVSLATTCLILSAGFFKPVSDTLKKQALYSIFAFSPVILVGFSVLVLMAMGVKINATLVTPFAMIGFSLIAFRNEHVFRFAEENIIRVDQDKELASQQCSDIFQQFSDSQISYRDAVSEIERIMVLHKYNQNEGNASSTAKQMGMPRSSLYSIFNRLMIETNG